MFNENNFNKKILKKIFHNFYIFILYIKFNYKY